MKEFNINILADLMLNELKGMHEHDKLDYLKRRLGQAYDAGYKMGLTQK